MVKDKIAKAELKYLDVKSQVDCQKGHAGTSKHGGEIKQLLKQ